MPIVGAQSYLSYVWIVEHIFLTCSMSHLCGKYTHRKKQKHSIALTVDMRLSLSNVP